jgi:hypothetical protein
VAPSVAARDAGQAASLKNDGKSSSTELTGEGDVAHHPAFQREVPGSMSYMGFPEIKGLRAIQPKILVTNLTSVAPGLVMASACETAWTRDVPEGEHAMRHHPWDDLEFRWTFENADGTPYETPARDLMTNPVPYLNGLPDRVDPAVHQIGPEFVMLVRRPGNYRIRLKVRGRDEHGRFIEAESSTLHCPTTYRWSLVAYDAWEPECSGTFTAEVTLPNQAPVSQTFAWNCNTRELKSWLESVCGADNVEIVGGPDQKRSTIAGVRTEEAPLGRLDGSDGLIRFVGNLSDKPVGFKTASNIVTTYPAAENRKAAMRSAPVFAMTGESAETFKVEPYVGPERYYDSNYDGAAGSPIGTFERPYTSLTQGPGNTITDPKIAIYLKRGGRYGVVAPKDATGSYRALSFTTPANHQGLRIMDYGDESLPRPVLFAYGDNPSANEAIFSFRLVNGLNARDVVFSGICFETWNPDSSLCYVTSRARNMFTQHLVCPTVGSNAGAVGMNPALDRAVMADCEFRWSRAQTGVQFFMCDLGSRNSTVLVYWNNIFSQSRGVDALTGGAGMHCAFIGNRFYGGGTKPGTPLTHTCYTEVGNHTLLRFQEYQTFGIDGLPFVGSMTHKISIWASNDGVPCKWYNVADVYGHGHAHTVKFGWTNPNLPMDADHAIWERYHHHRPGYSDDDGKSLWWVPENARRYTIRDTWYSRVGLNWQGGSASTGFTYPAPGGYFKCYRSRFEAPDNADSAAGYHMIALGSDLGAGAYFCQNVVSKSSPNMTAAVIIWRDSLPNVEMHDNIYHYAGGETRLFATFYRKGNVPPTIFDTPMTLAQMQSLKGLEVGSVQVSDPGFTDPGTDLARSNLAPKGRQPSGAILRVGTIPVHVGR